MSISVRRVNTAVVATIAILSAWPAQAGDVNCSCPSVKADGVGNSNCSTAEIDARCTVDFNVFDPAIEQAAREYIAKGSPTGDVRFVRFSFSSSQEGFDKQAADSLSQQNDGSRRLVDQILTYTMVALMQAKETDKYKIQQVIGDIHAMLVEASADASNAFLSKDSPFNRATGTSKVHIENGCIEIRLDDGGWFMFKTKWSPTREIGQCIAGGLN